MSSFIGPANPFSYAQHWMKGGNRGFWLLNGGFALVLIVMLYGTARLSDNPPGTSLANWTGILMFIQFVLLMGVASARINGSIKTDVKSAIMESHRLMPTPDAHVISGYIVGGALPMLAMFFTSLLIGAFVCLICDIQLSYWAAVCGLCLASAIFSWIVTAFLAMGGRSSNIFMILGFIVGAILGMFSLTSVPAMWLLAAPVSGSSLFTLRGSLMTLDTPRLLAIASQLLIAFIYFIGAMRKYRRPELVGLRVDLSTALLAIWALMSLYGLKNVGDLRPGFMGNRQEPDDQLWIGTAFSMMLMSLAMLANTARAAAMLDAEAKPGGNLKLLTSFAVALVLFAVSISPSVGDGATPILLATVLFGLFALNVMLWARWWYVRMDKAWLVIGIYVFCVALLPMLVELILYVATGSLNEEPGFSRATLLWAMADVLRFRTGMWTWVGMGFQALPLLIVIPLLMKRTHAVRAQRLREREVPAALPMQVA